MKRNSRKLVSNNKLTPLYYSKYENGEMNEFRKQIKNKQIKKENN